MGTEYYTVTETITRQGPRTLRVHYVFQENVVSNEGVSSTDKAFKTRGKREFETVVTREDYEGMILGNARLAGKIPFDEFICILRPIMMGSFQGNELELAFHELDKDGSGTIDVDELVSFLPIIDSNVNRKKILGYLGREEDDEDHNIDFLQFKDIVLCGIGRDLVVGNI